MAQHIVREWFRLAALLAALQIVAGGGCGYRLAGKGGTAHRSIAVPMFTNETLEYGLEEKATRAVADAFVADNRLEVVNPAEAETVLRGRVLSYKRSAFTFDEREQVQEYRVEMVLDLEYVEVASGKTIWREENFYTWASYDPVGKGEDEELGKQRAVEKAAREIVARTIEGW